MNDLERINRRMPKHTPDHPAASSLKAVEKQYFSVTETAAIIRSELKAAFPGVKFSVKSSRYSGGSSIRVGWTLGPNEDKIQAFVSKFVGSDFDPMIDLKSYVDTMYEGGLTHFASDHVFVNRHVPDLDKRVALVEEFLHSMWKDGHCDGSNRMAYRVIRYQREGETILEAIDRVIFGNEFYA